MKKIFTYTIALVFFLIGMSAVNAQVEKTIVKSLAVDKVKGIVLELPGELTLKEWDEDYARVLVNVTAMNTSEPILERLVAAGRYSIASTEIDNELAVEMPNMKHQVMIKGVNLNDKLNFIVYYPKGKLVRVQRPDYYESDQAL